MKKLLNAIVIVSALVVMAGAVSTSHANAQEYGSWGTSDDWNSYYPTYDGNTSYVDTTCYGCSTGSDSNSTYGTWGTSQDWNSYYPTYNGNTSYVDTTCYGCSTGSNSNSTYGTWGTSQDWNSYYPTYNGNTSYVDTTCAGCNDVYTQPIYTTPVDSYTSPTYTTPTYTTPTYTTPTYTSPTYIDTNYTTPGYVYNPGTVTNIVCPTGTLINGQCVNTITGTVITQVVCPAGSTKVNNQCINTISGTVITQVICPAGSTKVNDQCINTVTGNVVTNVTCPAGTTQQGNQCINNVNGTVVTNINCPAGTTQQGNQCINNINGNVVTNINCPPGTTLQNGQCINNVNGTVVTNINCPAGTQLINGACRQMVNPPVIAYQTCWDGSVIPSSSVCPQQFKICANGTSVPVNQTCFVPPSPLPVVPPVVKFNNVVTSPATQVTLNSGRCNGIGLIANGAPSTGWFEYGETANLGRTTQAASIGSAATAPFSNVLANLKPTTKYYCRAVMQNQYGIVKGEIVSFVTTAKATTYVKPVITGTKVSTSKVSTKKNEVVCVDGSTVKVSNQTSATLLNDGQKLITLQIEKVDGKIASEQPVRYKVSFKNLGDTRLTNVLLKVTLPQEITLTDANAGSYDPETRTLTFNIDGIDPYAEGAIVIGGTVVKDAPLGKTIVTNVYANYTVPGTKTQDEVTAYVVGSVVPTVDTTKVDTGAKKVVGATTAKGFLPNNLVEWLALIAILFIIFILGRSIYASYKEDEAIKH